MWHVWGTREMHRGFWWGDVMGRDHMEDLAVDESVMLKWMIRTRDGVAWTGLLWLRDGWRAVVNAVMNLRVP
jgi:hypothetical protein